jgi:hypothetical protein
VHDAMDDWASRGWPDGIRCSCSGAPRGAVGVRHERQAADLEGLRRAGFSQKGVFKIGEQYIFVGYQARDGSSMAFLESLAGPDGKTVKIWFGDPNAN